MLTAAAGASRAFVDDAHARVREGVLVEPRERREAARKLRHVRVEVDEHDLLDG
jgi:hypothetical protein